LKVLVDHREAIGGRTRVEDCGGSGEGEAPGLVGEILSTHLRKYLWRMYLGKMCHTNFWRKILRTSCSDMEFWRNQDFAQT